jgi:cellulose synthase/poly-beta-1,6-N-acetylglucosamine synthase-like glycosyltransferase
VYPVILLALASIHRQTTASPNGTFCPKVSVVIAVYNEEAVLDEKLVNIAETQYASDKIEFLIGSDGSTDQSNRILTESSNPHLRVVLFPHRRGKASVLNDLIPIATGDVVVLSDANTFYRPDTVAKLVSHFEDPTTGGVCGELILQADNITAGGFGESSYWQYENLLKHLESNIATTIGGVGPLYAIRRRLFIPLPTTKAIMDDFLIPLGIVKQGFKIRYDAKAIGFERPANSVRGEFRRKVRIGAANFNGISEFYGLLNPRAGFVAFALWSHKIIRWLVPFFLLCMAALSVVLSGQHELYRVFLYLEIAFMLAALLGYILERTRLRTGPFGLAYYFLGTNLALMIGFFKFLFRKQKPTWDVIR